MNVTGLQLHTLIKSDNEFEGSFKGEKVILKKYIASSRTEKTAKLLSDLNVNSHANIVKFIEHVVDDTANIIFFIYEHIEGVKLSDLLTREKIIVADVSILCACSCGLKFMHNKGYMHRDIKSSNVFVTSSGIIKLVGLDLACSFSSPEDLTPETGTYRWMAPEVIRHEPYDSSADVYSFGILMWELCTRELPYADLTAVQAAYAVAKNHLRPYMSLDINPRKKALISRCWHADASARPNMEDIEALLPSLNV